MNDFLRCGDPRLRDLDQYSKQAAARTCHLILQAAYREGMLADCDLCESGETLIWKSGDKELRIQGRIAGAGDRLKLDYDRWVLGLQEFLPLLRSLCPEPTNDAWGRLVEEASAANVTQSVAYAVASQRLRPQTYLDFEAWTPEGHNLHPGAKTRQGFSAQDQLDYAPELSDGVELVWLKVKRELLQSSGAVESFFRAADNDWLVPTHPWQLEHVIPEVYSEEWDRGWITPHPRPPLPAHICTSLRTVVPVDETLPILKLSVGSLMTSTERSMSHYTVLQGPVYTEYLERIRKADPMLFKGVVTAAETGGLCWARTEDERRSRNFSLLFRERPPQTGDGVLVPCSALPQPIWGGGGSYLSHFIKDRRTFQSYLRLLIPFHLRLYQEHGLALEAHLQNCAINWGAEGPTQVWVRDWGGLRADGEVLKSKAPELMAQLDPNSVTLSTAETAEKKLIACLYCNHLTEVVAGLSSQNGLSEADMWADIAEITTEHATGNLARRLLREPWPVKCLLKMRLGLGGNGDVYRLRENPLQ